MLTTYTRNYFQLQSLRSVKYAEGHQPHEGSLTKPKAESMTFVDPDAIVAHSVDPCELLGCPHHIAATKQNLHLGNKGINQIHPNTQLFSSLETLVLSDNRLTKLEGLLPRSNAAAISDPPIGCQRLKRLHLTNNHLSTLNGDIRRLKYLEVLLLGNNYLSNMETVSKQIAHLNYLKQLDLYGNPVAEEQSYRLYFIHRHPSLELLDRKTITDEERREAAALFGRSGRSGGGASSDTLSRTNSSASLPPLPSSSAAKLGAGGAAAVTSPTRGPQRQQVEPNKFFVFGSSYSPPADQGATASHRCGDALSGSAAILESKVRTIQLKRSADALRIQSQAQSELDDIAERRRLFHTIWEWSRYLAPAKGGVGVGAGVEDTNAGGNTAAAAAGGGGEAPKAQTAAAKGSAAAGGGGGGKAAPPSAQAAQAQQLAAAAAAAADSAAKSRSAQLLPPTLPSSTIRTTDPKQSSMFTDADSLASHPRVATLLSLARQIEQATEPERREALAEELRRNLHWMIPDRYSDGFQAALEQQRDARRSAFVASYLAKAVQELFTQQELSAVRRMFSPDSPFAVDLNALDALVECLDDKEAKRNVNRAQLRKAFAVAFGAASQAGGGGEDAVKAKKSSSSSGNAAVSLDTALQCLVCYMPFMKSRASFLQEHSAAALKRGDAEAARQLFRCHNEANEHYQVLARNATDGGETVVSIKQLRGL